ncbi:Reverse transcriptase domain [Arabidopsis thaliana x Arabidopsis arenosa]|uniref:Reverse transcriptase domain n=1 Tax=Arabidopsis thaliana x Arabidopsis arenosa TaxID=1240361 RepID=A0A8T1Y9Z7_9BRAS|nr:Reverse transcriptase domain [Arabidopsis thaliana x Arabidopsis arenosa]
MLEGFIPRVTEGMNHDLLRKVTKEEVKNAVFAIKPSSAPGADGMTGLFFQQYWDVVGNQITKEVRGLRQGDPLSPALFVLCAEGLTHLLNKAEREGNISGIQFSTNGPAIHHLLFADDSLFLIKAEDHQCNSIQLILSDYGKATGQVINLDKSSITFGDKVEPEVKTKIQEKMGILKEGGAGTYLGLPECFSGSKVDMLAYIQDKMKARMSSWYARTLSQGGKEILLKSVAMAMPVYFDEDKFINAEMGERPSFAWRSILHGRDLLNKGLRQMIGDGASTFVWTTRWLLDGVMRAPLMKNIIFDLDLQVKDLLDITTQTWDIVKLQHHFYPRDVELVLKMKPVMSSEDFLIWEHTKSGAYSVKSGYWFAYQREKVDLLREAMMQPSILAIKDQLWKTNTATKIHNFMWKAVSGGIPVVDKMIARGLNVDSRCQSCGLEGKRFCATATIDKIRDNVNQWFHAQSLDERDVVSARMNLNPVKKQWSPPPHDWLKCNLGSSWDKVSKTGGTAWVLRNEKGEVLLHSRRSFALVFCKLDASLQCWNWAIESMKSLNYNKVIFASEDKDLIGAVLRPLAWPSFKFHSRIIGAALEYLLEWKLSMEDRSSNLGAHLIARSVTREDRRQSYVATGFPSWLGNVFVAEMNEVDKRKETPDGHEKLVNEGSAARTRPTSVDEIRLRRKRKESLENVTEETVGVAQLLGNDLVEKASDYHESEKGYDRSKNLRHEEHVKDSSRKKEDAISSSMEEKLEKPMEEDPMGAAQFACKDLVEKVPDYHESKKGYDRSEKLRHEELVLDSSRKKAEVICSSREERLDKPMKDVPVGAAQLLGNDLVEKVSDYHASEKEHDRSKKVRREERVKDSSRKKEDATSNSREGKPMKEDHVGAAQLLGNDIVEKVSDYHASEKGNGRSKKVRREEHVKDSSRKKEEATSSSREQRLEKPMKEDPVGAAQLLGNDLVEKVSDYQASEKGHDRSMKVRREERVKESSRKKEEAISSSREEKPRKEDHVGARSAQLLGNDLVDKVSDYHESEKGYDRSEKLRREERVRTSSRKKEEAISSSREENLDKRKKEEEPAANRKRKAEGESSTAETKLVEEHRKKKESSAAKTTEKQIRTEETDSEQARSALENLSSSRKRLRSLVVTDRPRDENSMKPDNGNKRKNQNGDHKKNRERNMSKRHDPGKVHSVEVSERWQKREQPKSHQREMRKKRRRSRSRDHGQDRQKRSSPLPRAQKATSRHKRDHEERLENAVTDSSGKHHFNDNGNKVASTVNNKSKRYSASKSELGGYSPRKRREEASAKAVSPPNLSSEKKGAKWDLAPAVTAAMFSGSVFSGLQAAAQTAYPTNSEASMTLLKPLMEAPFRTIGKGDHINKEKSQALVEFLTPHDASAALSLDGCSFAGSNLKIRRPKGYVETRSGELAKKEPATNAISDNVKDSSNKFAVDSNVLVADLYWRISSEMLMEIVNKQCAFLEVNENPPFYGIPEHAKPLLSIF